MTAKKDLRKALTSDMGGRPTSKGTVADELVSAVLDEHFSSSIPATAFGRRPSRNLAPMDAATASKRLSVGSRETGIQSASLGPAPKKTGSLRPTAPQTQRSKPCPVKRRASASDAVILDTKTLASLFRRRGSEENLETKDDESSSEELPMTKAVTDIPRSDAAAILRPHTADPEKSEKIAQQKHVVEFLLSDDMSASMAVGHTQSGPADGVSEEQKRRLATRRRSRELSSLIQEGEAKDDENHTAELLIVADAKEEAKSKEEQYWQDMWKMAKSAHNDDKDVEDGDEPFQLKELDVGLLPPV